MNITHELYLPKDDRTPDTQYRDQLRRIVNEGKYTKHPFQPVGRRVLLTLPPMVFDMKNGFPLVTERWMPFSKSFTPISEMLAFINGVRTGKEMREWGVNWWSRWLTPDKCAIFGLAPDDMGDGAYGPGFNSPKFEWENVEGHPDGGRWVPQPFNQFYHLIKQIKEFPFLSTHKISCWIPHYCLQHSDLQRKVVVAPCHGDIQVTILGEELHLTMTQRSGDFPVGVPADIMMYATTLIMLAQLTGYKPGQLIYRVIDAHVYENQIDHLQPIIDGSREPFKFPELHLTSVGADTKSIFEFRKNHFELHGYEYHAAIPDIPITE